MTLTSTDIKTARERLHMTREDLASAAGLSLVTIYRIETGRKARKA